ncbi:hypothetical protein WJX84_007912 [Apatococcus fuscideae]|uniref:Uncharacterized protein n=1 Tax=Apatococcus fuscideae TaxID=2026836 RepID=A0AAW1TEG0_9CHLO
MRPQRSLATHQEESHLPLQRPNITPHATGAQDSMASGSRSGLPSAPAGPGIRVRYRPALQSSSFNDDIMQLLNDDVPDRAQLSHADVSLFPEQSRPRQYFSDDSQVLASVKLDDLALDATESLWTDISDALVTALQADPSRCVRCIEHAPSRIILTATMPHEVAAALRHQGAYGVFGQLLNGPQAHIWHTHSGQLQVGRERAEHQQGHVQITQRCSSSQPSISSLTPRCLAAASSHIVRADGHNLLPVAAFALSGRFQGNHVALKAEACRSSTVHAAGVQSLFIHLPTIHGSGILHIDCLHDDCISCSKQLLILEDPMATEDLQALSLSGLQEADMDAFLLDIGQVLPYMGIQATAAAMTPEEAAWVCPTALRLVRFARSQNWLAVASLIMAVASAGLSLEAAGQAMGADSQMSPYSRDMAGSSLHFPQAQAHFFSTATSARQQPYEQTAQAPPAAIVHLR